MNLERWILRHSAFFPRFFIRYIRRRRVRRLIAPWAISIVDGEACPVTRIAVATGGLVKRPYSMVSRFPEHVISTESYDRMMARLGRPVEVIGADSTATMTVFSKEGVMEYEMKTTPDREIERT